MTTATFQNVLIYGVIAIAVAMGGLAGIAIGSGAVDGFHDGQAFASVRIEVAGAIALMVSAGGQWLAANRPRVGGEQIAAQVDTLKASGYHRKDLTVAVKPGAVPGKVTEAGQV